MNELSELNELSEAFSALPEGGVAEEGQDYPARLWKLLSEQTERYTMKDSSSVPVETAEELLRSICYTLDFALEKKGLERSALAGADLDALLREGQALLLEEMRTVRRLWQRARSCAVRVENVYYRATLEDVAPYFSRYDHEFFAHRCCADLDYPLLEPVPETLLGLSYMRVYFERFNMENRLFNAFDARIAERLLCAAVPEHKNAFFNLCEPLLTNAAGLAILRKDVRGLDISQEERELLCEIFACAPGKGLRPILRGAAERLCREIGRDGEEMTAYVTSAMENLRPRLESALAQGDVSHIFISFLPENMDAAVQI